MSASGPIADIGSVRRNTLLPIDWLGEADAGRLEDRDSAQHVAPLNGQPAQFVALLGPEYLSTPKKPSLEEVELRKGRWHARVGARDVDRHQGRHGVGNVVQDCLHQ